MSIYMHVYIKYNVVSIIMFVHNLVIMLTPGRVYTLSSLHKDQMKTE